MSKEMEKVKQTTKAILFEEFDSSSTRNLNTFLKNEYDGNTEKFLDKLRELEVSTFEEFKEKFAPKVYETIMPDSTSINGFKVVYSTENKGGECREINITDHSFFKMVLRLYSEKGTSGQNNKSFDYDEIREMLTPQHEQREAKEIRKDLEYNFNKFLELEGDIEQTAERNKSGRKTQELRKKIIKNYNRSPISLIPLLLADTEEKLSLMKPSNNEVQEVITSNSIAGYLQYSSTGNLELIEGKNEREEIVNNSENSTKLITYISNDFDKYANENIKSNAFISDLVISSYVANNTLSNLSVQELEALKDQYQNVYKQSQESFISAVSIIAQKLMGVYIFFEHAGVEGKLEQPLIVANCRVEQLLKDDVKGKLDELIGVLNNTANEKIWFAILPALTHEEYKPMLQSSNDEEVINLDDFDLDDDDNNESSESKTNTSLQSAKTILKTILDKHDIMTFFNIYANDKTGFLDFTVDKLREYKKITKDINTENAVFTYPNFTILPTEKTYIKIGTDIEGKDTHIKIPGVYIDSSYVAAGLVVSYQNPKKIKAKGYEVQGDYPGVRFDIEKDDKDKRFVTNLNRENRLNWSRDIEEEINENLFGFCFTCNEIFINGNLIPNVSVYISRTMKINENKYTPIYKALTKKFVGECIRGLRTAREIKDFVSGNVSDWEADAEDRENIKNNILRKNEKIQFDSISNKLTISFKDAEEMLEVKIIND